MYVRLLSEAVLEERGESPALREEATVDLAVDAHIPESYIASQAQRIDMYKKMSLILTEEDRGDVLDELCDRFGEPPRTVLRLLDVALARALATRAGMTRIEQRGSDLKFSFDALSLAAWSEAFIALPGLRMVNAAPPYVTYRLPRGKDPAQTILTVLFAYLSGMQDDTPKKEEGK
jgi:transcription-repair coupling factor (superfamily II helicase)